MNKFENFTASLGFKGVYSIPSKKDPKQIRCLGFERFDPKQVRHTMGRAKAHTEDLFVFVLRSGQGVRVNTVTKRIVLGNGKKAVKALLRTIPN